MPKFYRARRPTSTSNPRTNPMKRSVAFPAQRFASLIQLKTNCYLGLDLDSPAAKVTRLSVKLPAVLVELALSAFANG